MVLFPESFKNFCLEQSTCLVLTFGNEIKNENWHNSLDSPNTKNQLSLIILELISPVPYDSITELDY